MHATDATQLQEHALGAMRAGAAMSAVEAGSRRVIVSRLLDMGLVRGSVDELIHKKVDRQAQSCTSVSNRGQGQGPVRPLM